MLKYKILLITCLLISFNSVSYSQSGWQIQYSESPGYFNDIYFINNLSGWAVQVGFDGKITKTVNGGLNWVTITSNQFSFGNGIVFHDQSLGWICASAGSLYRSTNGGNNWMRSNCNGCSNVDDFVDIQFINQNTGWAYGDATAYKSTDGGLNYFPLYCGTDVENGIFLDSLNGWVGGFGATTRSTNGGISWFQYSQVNGSVTGLHFTDINKGWLTTYNGKIFKTTNSGVNWIEQYSNNGTTLYKVQFVNDNTGWVVGASGAILKTTNGGTNWYRQTSQPITTYWGIFMISPNEGWVCGEHYILHTTDGGGPIGIKPISNEVPQSFSLSQNYPNPFNPVTRIKFSIPLSRGVSAGRGVSVSLTTYDALGREIAILVNEQFSPGTYETEWDGSNYPSGVYFYKLTAGDYAVTKKMILIK